ncbi:MAG: hypothetical protein DLM53_01330 [Candidatus Eremiobacter antarcticus]|nr:glycosyltransferase [Candidatus Eremiobacteraeota bacterium]MBC5808046.1 glycosyltransferase [Candidatus Eremiobacteraeota bacterium]PZR63453.1 MAG: hypothetical protein DLM53_01330 [Candidatus Eremiobacter sp. RRmetagenome_bin22]
MLRRAIRSVLSQTFENLRVCVYDNASHDATEQVVSDIAAVDPRVTYHCHSSNIGGVDNLLYGMQRVETPFFSFLSDDDVVFPEFFALALTALEQHPDAMMFAGSTLEVTPEGKLLFAPIAHWPREGEYLPPEAAFQMLGNKHPTWTSILFRRVVIDRIGLLDRQVGAPSDLDYELRVAAHFPIVISYHPCGAYVSHSKSGSASENTSVVPGYRKMIARFENDESLAPGARAMLAARLGEQLQLKILEIAVKSTVRRHDETAREALMMLRHTESSSAQLRLLSAVLSVCLKVSAARSILVAAESLRLRFRSWRSACRSKRTYSAQSAGGSDLLRYSGYLAFDPP